MALGGGLGTVIVAIAITRIPFGGRVIRSVVLSLKEMQYVEAARGLGASHLRLMFRHILPQCVAPYLILATTHLGVAIVIEASLGFLGVGIPPPTPTWGNMLSDALNAGLVPPWWLVLFPGRRDHAHRAGLQPAGRRHPRHARSAVARVGLGDARHLGVREFPLQSSDEHRHAPLHIGLPLPARCPAWNSRRLTVVTGANGSGKSSLVSCAAAVGRHRPGPHHPVPCHGRRTSLGFVGGAGGVLAPDEKRRPADRRAPGARARSA